MKTTIMNQTIYTTEELNLLVTAVKQQGGAVIGTYSNRAGHGVTVRYQIPGDTNKSS